MSVTPGLTNDEYFRGIHISHIAQNTSQKFPWQPGDRIFFSKHAARYQMTGRSDISLGLDEVVRELGITNQSEYYKNAVLTKVKSALLYLVTDKFRQEETRVLIKPSDDIRGESVWRWPEYTRRWLRADWNGQTWPLEGDDPERPRRDTPRMRARTPKGRRRCRTSSFCMSGALGHGQSRGGRDIIHDGDNDDNSTYVYSHNRHASVLRDDDDSDDNDDDDDGATFSDDSDRTILPPRRHSTRPAKKQPASRSGSSISEFVQQELEAQQNRMDQKFNSIIDIMKDFCSRSSTMNKGDDAKQRIDDLPPIPNEDPIPYMPSPPATPPSTRTPSQSCHGTYCPLSHWNTPPSPAELFRLFPGIPPHIANYDPWDGRNVQAPRARPPDESQFQIPSNAPQTRSRELLSEALKYATVEVQHNFHAAVAGMAGDLREQFEQQCGAKFARTKRDEFAQKALEAELDEMEGMGGVNQQSVRVPAILRKLMGWSHDGSAQ
ncbi:hypothetical protein CEP51_015751 [Fusarium floridanum]|uniref:Uncharacterized protein n=1 Tax=Fusarium floridanum TaxID=1325733 RepID=A0A428P3K7_9HYPO|nr:hypothetical protein CEP51_015751 [Fusarium floridanum]